MGTSSSRVGEYMKLTRDQRALVKQIWIGIENNPQFHGSVFFMGFCEIHPQYTKYFTTDSEIPLTFDARTNAKFTIIMETMGYILLDFHNKPKQLDRIIAYIAMIHKDMSLEKSDMLNFGVCLLEYLSVTFPMVMTPECLEIISNYMNNLLIELSQKIDDFKNDETLGNYEVFSKTKIPCSSWLFCRDNLIHGRTVGYWRERKNQWEERLDDWKVKESTNVQMTKSSSTDDEETSILKSKTEDEMSEFAESTARLLESHGIPRTTKIDKSSQSIERLRGSGKKITATRSRGPLNRAKKHDTIVEDATSEIPASNYKTPRERRRTVLAEISSRSSGPHEEAIRLTSSSAYEETKRFARLSDQLHDTVELRVPFKSEKIDSSARQRRRRTQARLQPS